MCSSEPHLFNARLPVYLLLSEPTSDLPFWLPQGNVELGAMFIEGDAMAESTYSVV
jgi:hypothetical protein